MTTITVSDGSQTKNLTIRESDIRVEGQTSGEWVSLGSVNLLSGKKSYVDVSIRETNGIVVADAVLFVPK